MTPDLLKEIGETLYGRNWPHAFARALDVPSHRVQAWSEGTDIPDRRDKKAIGVLLDAHLFACARLKRALNPSSEPRIDRRILQDLISAGAHVEPEAILAAAGPDLLAREGLDRRAIDWRSLTDPLSIEDVAALFRALIVLANAGRWGGRLSRGIRMGISYSPNAPL